MHATKLSHLCVTRHGFSVVEPQEQDTKRANCEVFSSSFLHIVDHVFQVDFVDFVVPFFDLLKLNSFEDSV